MTRILGLDYGEKRIGVALSDPTGMIASPLEVLQLPSKQKILAAIKELCAKWKVGRIVVGVPLNMNGTEGPSAQKAREFIVELQEQIGLPVTAWDERLSSTSAEKALIEGGTRREKRKQVIDKIAAQIILQNYLDAQAYLASYDLPL